MSIKTVTCRGVTLGEGKPKICIPIVGTTQAEILSQAAAIRSLPADIVEWRCDWYAEVTSPEVMTATLRLLRAALGPLPLLLTFRTSVEGGQAAITPEDYIDLLQLGIASGCVDLVDMELRMGKAVFDAILPQAHSAGVAVIASNHDFNKTPPHQTLVDRLQRMEDYGADVAKIAVMPQSPADVLTLLSATLSARAQLQVPLITMSMGSLGAISRLSGQIFGSAMTFGAAEQASAPGQIDAARLAELLDLLKL